MLADTDLQLLSRAAEIADASAGLTQPHPAAGCVLVSADGAVVAETHQRAQVNARVLHDDALEVAVGSFASKVLTAVFWRFLCSWSVDGILSVAA